MGETSRSIDKLKYRHGKDARKQLPRVLHPPAPGRILPLKHGMVQTGYVDKSV